MREAQSLDPQFVDAAHGYASKWQNLQHAEEHNADYVIPTLKRMR